MRSRDAAHEKMVRSVAHRLRYRFRLSDCRLPGTPGLIFHRLRAAYFVPGCFRHQKEYAREPRVPRLNQRSWREKLGRNTQRDTEATRSLRRLGWRVLLIR
ncbi:MAG: very short patch repair endonuclease [Tepidisphaera sp.]